MADQTPCGICRKQAEYEIVPPRVTWRCPRCGVFCYDSLEGPPRIRSPDHMVRLAHFFRRRFEEAASKFLLDIQGRPYRPRPYQYLAACYAHLGRIDEARAVVARLRAITPLVVPDELPLRNPDHRELFLSGLRLAVGEET